jgi:hypothetical protein
VPIASAAHGARTGAGRSSDRSRGLHPTVDQSIASGIGKPRIELEDGWRRHGLLRPT